MTGFETERTVDSPMWIKSEIDIERFEEVHRNYAQIIQTFTFVFSGISFKLYPHFFFSKLVPFLFVFPHIC